MPAVRRAGMADGGERSGAEHTLRVVHEEVLDEAQLAAVAGGSTDPQTSSGRITVTSEGLIGGIRIIGGRLDTEPNTL